MPARIEVGRKGCRGAYRTPPSVQGCLVVDCTVISDPLHRPNKSKSEKKKFFPVPVVAEKLESVHGSKFLDLVDKVVQGVLEDKVVHVQCMMGQNRSQAVAWRAAEKLRVDHPAIPFEGPVCLPGLVSRIPGVNV